jgi:phosphate transport system substrate-binding protein
MGPPREATPTRRRLLASGTALLATLAGCSSFGGRFGSDATPTGGSTMSTSPPTATPSTVTDAGSESGPEPDTGAGRESEPGRAPLRVRARIPWPWLEEVIGVWNANADPREDDLLWDRLGTRPAFDARVADHFASKVGLSPTGERASPPFRIALGVSSTGDASGATSDGRSGLWATGSTRTPPPVPDDRTGDLREYVYGLTGYRVLVGATVAAAGVRSLPLDRFAAILEGEVRNWRAVGGPDREIYAVGPATGTPPSSFERFRYERGIGVGGLDARAGIGSNAVRLVAERDGLGIVRSDLGDPANVEGVVPLSLRVDGRVFDVYDRGYPTTEPKPLWTVGDPGPRERAVVRLVRSAFGQRLIGRYLLPAFPGGVDTE